MFLCLLVLPIVGIWQAGGWGETMAAIAAADPALLRPMGEHGMSVMGVMSAISFVGIGLAFLGAPQLLTRFMSARDRGQISEGGVIAVACIIVFDIGAVLTGVAGRVLFPGLGDPETVLPVMSTELFPAIVAGVILVVVLAAIMSTVDSLLILASSAVVRDTVQKVFRPDFSDRRLALIGRGLTVVIGLGGLAVALPESRMIFWPRSHAGRRRCPVAPQSGSRGVLRVGPGQRPRGPQSLDVGAGQGRSRKRAVRPRRRCLHLSARAGAAVARPSAAVALATRGCGNRESGLPAAPRPLSRAGDIGRRHWPGHDRGGARETREESIRATGHGRACQNPYEALTESLHAPLVSLNLVVAPQQTAPQRPGGVVACKTPMTPA